MPSRCARTLPRIATAAVLTAVLGAATAGRTAPRRPSPLALQRLQAAGAQLDRALRGQSAVSGKRGELEVQRALDSYNAAREAAYGTGGVGVLAGRGSFDGSTPESEPNNTTAAANSLDVVLLRESAAVVTAEIRAAGDVDVFSFSAPAGARVWAYTDTGGPQNAGANSRDTVLTLLAPDGTTVIEEDDDDGTGNGCDGTVESGLSSVIAGRQVPTDGTHFLRVRGFSAAHVISPYRLYVVLSSSPAAETEPNDAGEEPDALVPIGGRSGLVTGAAAFGDVDLFLLALQAGDTATLQLDKDPNRDGTYSRLELALLNVDGSTILSAFDADPSGNSGEGFCFRAPANGVYGIRVSSVEATGSTDYVLLATVCTRPVLPNAPPVIRGVLGSGSEDYPATSGLQVGRILRNGVPSNTVAPKPFPGIGATTGFRAFDAYIFQNRTAVETPVKVTMVYDGVNANLFTVTYSTYDPGNLAPGYLADSGQSGTPQSHSLRVAPGEVFVVIVYEVTPPAGAGVFYTLTVEGDFAASLVSCPADITVPNDLNQAGAVVGYTPPGVSDPSLGPVTCTPPPGSFFPLGTTTVTCQDRAGNQCTFQVTVRDVQPPAVTVPNSVGAAQDQSGGAVVNYAASASDNAPGVTLSCSPASGTLFPLGVTLVTCTATDTAGNTTSRSFLVTVSVPASTPGVRIAGAGTIATGTPPAKFKVSGSVSATGVPTRVVVMHTQTTAAQALKSTSITAVVRAGNLVRILGKIRNGRTGVPQDFMLEIRDVAPRGANQDTYRLDVRNGFQLAQTVIKTGDISIR